MSHPIAAVPAPVVSAPPRSAWWALVVLALAQLMLVLDVTVVNVALPRLSAELGRSVEVSPGQQAALAG